MRPIRLAVLFVLLSAAALADYDRTRWGMFLETVKTLYPGGVLLKDIYQTDVDVAGIPSLVQFQFGSTTGLQGVSIFPRKSGSLPNADVFEQRYTAAEVNALVSKLRKLLTKKYGKPIGTKLKCELYTNCVITWKNGKGSNPDIIYLIWTPYQDGFTTPSISYWRAEHVLEALEKVKNHETRGL